VPGTGASCVYPLLGAKLNDWRFTATDADATNVDYALANVAQNNLSDKIKGRFSFLDDWQVSFFSAKLSWLTQPPTLLQCLPSTGVFIFPSCLFSTTTLPWELSRPKYM